jgi:hypothetical protein
MSLGVAAKQQVPPLRYPRVLRNKHRFGPHQVKIECQSGTTFKSRRDGRNQPTTSVVGKQKK